MHKDDRLWKGILEDVCDDFLTFFFPEATSTFDFERGFVFLDKELEQLFPSDEGRHPRFVDKLIKVYTHAGAEEWILVHVEVQGYADHNFGRRMFTYFYRILDRYDKPVTALAIFSDSVVKYAPDRYEYQFLGTSNVFLYNTYKIMLQDSALLAADPNPFARVVEAAQLAIAARKIPEEELFNLKFSLAKRLLKSNLRREKVNSIFEFLNRYVTFGNQELSSKFDQEIDTLTRNTRPMGIIELIYDLAKKDAREEGIEIGMEKGLEKEKKAVESAKTEIVTNLLNTGKFSVEEIAEITDVDVSVVRRVHDALRSSN